LIITKKPPKYPPTGFIGRYSRGPQIFSSKGRTYIYETINPARCEKLCLKLVRANQSQISEARKEIEIMETLNHPNIMKHIDSFEIPNFLVIVLPLATGGDLYDFVYDNGPLKEPFAAKVAYDILQALENMHAQDIWHRDIKPENVVLMDSDFENPRVVLADLGFAKQFSPGELCDEFLGTLGYQAPEIFNSVPCIFLEP
jgi:serine/threonine protein kinase